MARSNDDGAILGAGLSINPLIVLAEHAAVLRARPLSEALNRDARRALIDWFAALFAGRQLPPATLLAKALPPVGEPWRSVRYTDGLTSDVRSAALMNGVASHTAEFDDIFRDAGYHPGSATISAALAFAQDRQASFDDLLRAIVVGYEVSCRIALAVQPSHYRYWHPTATIGAFGAAAACSAVLQMDAESTANALALAATMASGLQHSLRGDGMGKALQVGHAADAGCLAALAAAGGATGDLDVLHGPVGYAAATSDGRGDWDQALANLGARFLIGEITIKNHGCCGHAFAALDGIAELRRIHGFGVADIAHIHVESYAAAKEICDRPVIHDAQQARLSLQYCIGALLRLGSVRLDAFGPRCLQDPQIKGIMDKVTVAVDPEIAKGYPTQRAARVTIDLIDGTRLERFQPTRKGDPDAPLSDIELSEKFIELSTPVLGTVEARDWLDALWNSDDIDRLSYAARRLEAF
jgi:2-methylcitrate dehydratase PrpD